MRWKDHIRTALAGDHPRFGALFEMLILGLIGMSSLAMGIETFPGLPDAAVTGLAMFEVAVVAVFTLEYALRIYAAESRLGYVFSFFGLMDLLSILPFFAGLLLAWNIIDLRFARTLRLFRLFRLMKLVRYTSASERLSVAWSIVREEVIVFGAASLVVLYVCALVIYQFEHPVQPEAFASILDAMWWAAITLTTVGYGDVYPVTGVGRLFTVIMLFAALGVIAIPTGLVSSALTTLRSREMREARGEEGPGEKGPGEENGTAG